MDSWIGQLILSVLGVVVWYLLQQKDAQQAKDIATLWTKHDDDAQSLQDLRIQIAGRHYERSELDNKFDKLDSSITRGFENMALEFKQLSNTLIKHMSEENGRLRKDGQ